MAEKEDHQIGGQVVCPLVRPVLPAGRACIDRLQIAREQPCLAATRAAGFQSQQHRPAGVPGVGGKTLKIGHGAVITAAQPRCMAFHRHQLFTGIPTSWYRSEEHTSELQSLMRLSYAVFCLKKKT